MYPLQTPGTFCVLTEFVLRTAVATVPSPSNPWKDVVETSFIIG